MNGTITKMLVAAASITIAVLLAKAVAAKVPSLKVGI